jgi:hypothetical protein
MTAGPGRLIHTADGGAGGSGGFRTNRLGCAAYAAVRIARRRSSTASVRPEWTTSGVSYPSPSGRCSVL